MKVAAHLKMEAVHCGADVLEEKAVVRPVIAVPASHVAVHQYPVPHREVIHVAP